MIFLAELQARPDSADAVLDILHRLAAQTAAEPGAAIYLFHQSAQDPTRIVLYERYRDAAAADAHMGSAHVRAAIETFGPLLAQPPRLTQLTPAGGFGQAL